MFSDQTNSVGENPRFLELLSPEFTKCFSTYREYIYNYTDEDIELNLLLNKYLGESWKKEGVCWAFSMTDALTILEQREDKTISVRDLLQRQIDRFAQTVELSTLTPKQILEMYGVDINGQTFFSPGDSGLQSRFFSQKSLKIFNPLLEKIWGINLEVEPYYINQQQKYRDMEEYQPYFVMISTKKAGQERPHPSHMACGFRKGDSLIILEHGKGTTFEIPLDGFQNNQLLYTSPRGVEYYSSPPPLIKVRRTGVLTK